MSKYTSKTNMHYTVFPVPLQGPGKPTLLGSNQQTSSLYSSNSLSPAHRTRKRFRRLIKRIKLTSTIHRPFSQFLVTLISLQIIILVCFSQFHQCLDSPIKIQRNKQLKQTGNSFTPATTIHTLSTSTSPAITNVVDHKPDQTSISNEPRAGRVRRTDNRQVKSSHEKCAYSEALLQGLLQAEFLASSGHKTPRGKCTCQVEGNDEVITCAPRLELSRSHHQTQTNRLMSMPRTRVIRAAARWMGDREDNTNDDALVASSSSSSESDNESQNQPINPTMGSSFSSHEGFGEDPASLTTVRPPNNMVEDQQFNQQITKPSRTSSEAKPNHKSSSTHRNPIEPKRDGSDEDSFISAPSSNNPLSINNSNDNSDNTDSTNRRLSMGPASHLIDHSILTELFKLTISPGGRRIKIECDTSAPNYKPAMFQGFFDANETRELELSNCPLPQVSFRWLLASSPPNQRSTADCNSRLWRPSADQQDRDEQDDDHETAKQQLQPESRLEQLKIRLDQKVTPRRFACLLAGLTRLTRLQMELLKLELSQVAAPGETLDADHSTTTSSTSGEQQTQSNLGQQAPTPASEPESGMLLTQSTMGKPGPLPVARPPSSGTTSSSTTSSTTTTSTTTTSTSTTTTSTTTTTTSTTTTTTPAPSSRQVISSSMGVATTTPTSTAPQTAIPTNSQQQRPRVSRPPTRTSTSVVTQSPLSMGAPRGLMMSQPNAGTTANPQLGSSANSLPVPPVSISSSSSVSNSSSSSVSLGPQVATSAGQRLVPNQRQSAGAISVSLGNGQPGQSVTYSARPQPPPTTTVIAMTQSSAGATGSSPSSITSIGPTTISLSGSNLPSTVTSNMNSMTQPQSQMNGQHTGATGSGSTDRTHPPMPSRPLSMVSSSSSSSSNIGGFTSSPGGRFVPVTSSAHLLTTPVNQPAGSRLAMLIPNSASNGMQSDQPASGGHTDSSWIFGASPTNGAGPQAGSGFGVRTPSNGNGNGHQQPSVPFFSPSVGLRQPSNQPATGSGSNSNSINRLTTNPITTTTTTTTSSSSGFNSVGSSFGGPPPSSTPPSSRLGLYPTGNSGGLVASTQAGVTTTNINNDAIVAPGGRLSGGRGRIGPTTPPPTSSRDLSLGVPHLQPMFRSHPPPTPPNRSNLDVEATFGSASSVFSDALTSAVDSGTELDAASSTGAAAIEEPTPVEITRRRLRRAATNGSTGTTQTNTKTTPMDLSLGELLPNLQHLEMDGVLQLGWTFGSSSGSANVRLRRRSTSESVTLVDDGSSSSLPVAGELSLPADSGAAARHRLWAEQVLGKLFSKLRHLRHLELRDNRIPYWPNRILVDSANSLDRLSLSSNQLETLGVDSLANLTRLTELDLSRNNIRQLNPEQLRHLTGLHSFRANSLLIQKLPSRLLPCEQPINQQQHQQHSTTNQRKSQLCGNLTELMFNSNPYLSHIAADAFVPALIIRKQSTSGVLSPSSSSPNQPFAHRVKKLSLNNSSLADDFVLPVSGSSSSDQLVFGSLTELVQLELAANKLRDLRARSGLFERNRKLEQLILAYNKIAWWFDEPPSLGRLAKLDLSSNRLNRLEAHSFERFRQLTHLLLGRNQLTQLPAHLFRPLVKLRRLSLAHNHLQSLATSESELQPFGPSDQLTEVDLSHNKLTDFGADILPIRWHSYAHLERLSLASNQFWGSIQVPLFHSVAKQLLVDLSNNSIQTVLLDELEEASKLNRKFNSLDIVSSADGIPGGITSAAVGAAGSSLTSGGELLEPTANQATRTPSYEGPTRVGDIEVHLLLARNPLLCDCHLSQLRDRFDERNLLTIEDPAAGSADPGSSSAIFLHTRYLFPAQGVKCRLQKGAPDQLAPRPLAQRSLHELMCPVFDRKLCPSQCECHYGSAYHDLYVDCANRSLDHIPNQLLDASNFVNFTIKAPTGTQNQLQVINKVERLRVYLSNNQIRSIEPLVSFFQFIDLPNMVKLTSGDLSSSSSSSAAVAAAAAAELSRQTRRAPLPVAPTTTTSTPQPSTGRKKMSPVMAGRSQASQLARPRRFVSADDFRPLGEPVFESTDPVPRAQVSLGRPAQLASPVTVKLHLDNNLIERLPSSFLAKLDHVSVASLSGSRLRLSPDSQTPAAMQQPFERERIDHHLQAPGEPELGGDSTTSGGTPTNRLIRTQRSPAVGEPAGNLPLDKEAISSSIALNQRRLQQVTSGRLSNDHDDSDHQQSNQNRIRNRDQLMLPILTELSLNNNLLTGIQPVILRRLEKLWRANPGFSLRLGHNPFNCTPPAAGESNNDSNDQLDHTQDRLHSMAQDKQNIHSDINANPTGFGSLGEPMLMEASESGGPLLVAADSGEPVGHLESGSGGAQAQCALGQLQALLHLDKGPVADQDDVYCAYMTADLANELRIPAEPLSEQPAELSNNQSISSSGSAWPLSASSSWIHKDRIWWNHVHLSEQAKLSKLRDHLLCPLSFLPISAGLLSPAAQTSLLLLLAVFLLISLTLVLMLIYFGDTQTMLAFVYIHLNPVYRCLKLSEQQLDQDKLYDAFVSYSSADQDLVVELAERLEQTGAFSSTGTSGTPPAGLSSQPGAGLDDGRNSQSHLLSGAPATFSSGTMSRSSSRASVANGPAALTGSDPQPNGPYRLCIHERDWLPGHLISWNIVNSVQNSRRTIMVISKEFIKSVWFQVEFHAAYYQMFADKVDRLIVIVRGELPPRDELDKDLAFLLTTKTYLVWGERWFWEKLHYALPHRAQGTKLNRKQHQQLPQHHHQPVLPKAPQHRLITSPSSQLLTQGGSPNGPDTELALTGSANDHHKPLLVASGGKDLLVPVKVSGGNVANGCGSSKSSTSSNLSYLSSNSSGASSTGNLLQATGTGRQPSEEETSNDALSQRAPLTTTRLTIGSSTGTGLNIRSSSPHNNTNTNTNINQTTTSTLTNSSLLMAADSGRVSSINSSAFNSSAAPINSAAGGVTSILLDGSAGGGAMSPSGPPLSAYQSRVRAEKQRRLQSIVDREIASKLDLSEL